MSYINEMYQHQKISSQLLWVLKRVFYFLHFGFYFSDMLLLLRMLCVDLGTAGFIQNLKLFNSRIGKAEIIASTEPRLNQIE